jgi:hypothetical protein
MNFYLNYWKREVTSPEDNPGRPEKVLTNQPSARAASARRKLSG